MWLQHDESPRLIGRHVTKCSDLTVVQSALEDLIPEPSIRQISLTLICLVGIREGIGFPRNVADEEQLLGRITDAVTCMQNIPEVI